MNTLLQVMIISVALDRLLGEPSVRFHTTAWMGRLISALEKRSEDSYFHGALLFAAVALPSALIAFAIVDFAGVESIAAILLASIILKLQFAWRSLGEHAHSVVRSLENDIDEARKSLSRVVGRDTTNLDGEQVISATVESVGESSVDGIISPLFYYVAIGGFFGVAYGVAAAAFYRAVNTLDSMVGYKKEGYYRLGFVSARADDVLNYIPARLASILIVISSALLREDALGAMRILWRDRSKTASPNSGYSMAAVAGALGVRLEKVDFHRLGDQKEKLVTWHVTRALRLVDLTVLVFLALSFMMFS